MSETIGRMLQRLRVERGLTQKQLAKAADVNLGTLRNWEIDYREPGFRSLFRLAQELGVSTDIFADTDEVEKGIREPRAAGPTKRPAPSAKPGAPKKAGRPRKAKS